jgi:hypothetical protein
MSSKDSTWTQSLFGSTNWLASVRPKIAVVRVFVVLRGVAVAEDGG